MSIELPPPASLRQDTALGVFYLCAGIGLFAIQDLVLKLLSDTYPLSEAMILRGLTAMPLLAMLAMRDGGLRTLFSPAMFQMIVRGIVMFSAYACYYLALPALPIATTVALYFTAPLFITVLSFFWLKERVGWRRWGAVALGFLGVLIMIRPTGAVFDWAALIVLGSGLSYGFSMILARRLGVTETAPAMAFWGNFVFLTFALGMALVFGDGRFMTDAHPTLGFLFRALVWPTPFDAMLMCACGVIAAVGLTLLTQAYRIADSNAVAPFEYTYMLWGVFWGWMFFAEWPDAIAWIGIGVIMAAGLLVLWREKIRDIPPAFDRAVGDEDAVSELSGLSPREGN